MSLPSQNFDNKNNTDPRARRQRWALMISLTAAIISLVFGGLALQQRNSAIQRASTAQAASTFAAVQQATGEATAEAMRAQQMKTAEAAQIQVKAARANEIAAQSLAMRDKDFIVSMLLGLEAYYAYNTPRSMGAVLDNARAYPQILSYLHGHKKFVTAAVFSPDGTILASASCTHTGGMGCDGQILLHDLRSNQPAKALKMHTSLTGSLAFSPNGSRLASSSLDQSIILWDVKTGQPIGDPIDENAYSVAFSPDGKILASGGCLPSNATLCVTGSVKLWDAKTGQPLANLLEQQGGITGIAFSPDGNTLAAADFAGTLFLWDMKTRKLTEKRVIRQSVTRLQFLPNGDLASMGMAGDVFTVMVLDRKTHQPVSEPIPTSSYQVVISPDGSTLVRGTPDGLIVWENLQTHEKILSGEELDGDKETHNILAISPDGKTLAVTGHDRNTIILAKRAVRTEPLGNILQGEMENPLGSIAFSLDGQMLAAGGRDALMLWDLKTGHQIGEPLTARYGSSIALSPDGNTSASGGCAWEHGYSCQQAEIILWDLKSGQPIGTPLTSMEQMFVDNYYSIDISSLAFSPDGNILASASFRYTNPIAPNISENHNILLWDVKTGKLIGNPLKGHTDSVKRIVFSPHGTMLASAGIDGNVILWDIKTSQAIAMLREHTDAVTAVTFSPDGKILVSGGLDSQIIFWDLATMHRIGSVSVQPSRVFDVAFSPDGRILASASSVSSVTLWDVATLQPIGEPLYESLAGGLGSQSLAFSPDGTIVASRTSASDHIILWDVNPQSWIERTCLRAGRNFTPAEWVKYFPSEAYRATCPQWPLEKESATTP